MATDAATPPPITDAATPAPVAAGAPVCSTCGDTHMMPFGENRREVMCTHCPVPCDKCIRPFGRGPYCETTPCSCACHPKPTSRTTSAARVPGARSCGR